jgi:hypothetical protein
MSEQTSPVTTDDHVENSVTYDEYRKSFETLLDLTTNNSSSTADNGSIIPTHTLLPFETKSTSSGIYSIEKETNEKNI